jgi:hypothetical protein
LSLFATEKLPSPMAMAGIVSIDNWRRNLVVSRPDTLGGYEKLSWRTAHEHLYRAEQSGWRSGAPTLWASGVRQTDIAYGVPGDNLSLLFHFPAVADSPYSKLVGQPGLAAFVTVDRSTHWFMGVTFRHNRQGSAAA